MSDSMKDMTKFEVTFMTNTGSNEVKHVLAKTEKTVLNWAFTRVQEEAGFYVGWSIVSEDEYKKKVEDGDYSVIFNWPKKDYVECPDCGKKITYITTLEEEPKLLEDGETSVEKERKPTKSKKKKE